MDCLHNRDAELSIIGTALNDMECAVKLAAASEDLFTAADTKAAHKGIKRIIAAGGSCDIVTVDAAIHGEIADITGMLMQCSQMGFLPTMYGQYEDILCGCLKRRAMVTAAKALLADSNNPAANPDAVSAAAIDMLIKSDASAASVTMEQALMEFINELSTANQNRCMTGIATLDRITGGFLPGQYIAVGARPGVGKSAFGLYTAVNIARTRGPVLIASIEMQPAEIAARQVSAESGVDGQDINTGDLDEEACKRMAEVYPDIARLQIRIAKRIRTPLQLRREAVRMKYGEGLAAVVVDYLGLMDSDRPSNSRHERYSDISRELKILAGDIGVPFIILTQVNRNSEAGKTNTKRPPTMSDARDTGSIEQDADKFILLHSPEDVPEYKPGSIQWEAHCTCERESWTRQWMIVEKNRRGKKGMATVGFDAAHMKYHSLTLQEAQ